MITTGQQKKPLFQFGLSTLLAAVAIVAILLGADFLGVVDFRYPQSVNNEALSAPLRVMQLDGNALVLEDGRVIQLVEVDDSALPAKWGFDGSLVRIPYSDDPVQDALWASNYQVDIELEDGSNRVTIYVRRIVTKCGNHEWRLCLPLIPEVRSMNVRWRLGTGEVHESRGEFQAQSSA